MAHIGHLNVGGSKCNCSIKLEVSRSSPSNHFSSEKLLSYTYLKNVTLSFCLICSYSNSTHLTCLLFSSRFVAIRTSSILSLPKSNHFYQKLLFHYQNNETSTFMQITGVTRQSNWFQYNLYRSMFIYIR